MQNLKRRARIASCLAISLLASALFAKEAPSSAKDPLEPALAALRTLQYQRAIGLFDTAANAGNTRAQYLLGLIYLNGVGVAADPARARALLRSAAEHGHGAAAYVLAGELARDTPPDPAAVRQWLDRAAALGYARAADALKSERPLIDRQTRGETDSALLGAWVIDCAVTNNAAELRTMLRAVVASEFAPADHGGAEFADR